MQHADDPQPTNEKAGSPTGDRLRLRALIDSAIMEAEACGELMIVADLSAIADRIVKHDDDAGSA